MDLKLYEISNEYLELCQELIETEGELSPELEQKMEINETNKKTKFENYAKLIRHLEGNIEIRNKEAERLGALNQTDEKLIENLKNRLKYTMELYKEDKFDTPLFKFSLRHSESVEIVNGDLIPEQFKTVVTPEPITKISKNDIKKYLKENEESEVAGAVLRKNKTFKIK